MFRLFFLFSLLISVPSFSQNRVGKSRVESVALGGYVGQRYADCLNNRVKPENLDTLISVFRKQDETHNLWGSEFWGKWIQGAVGMYRYTGDEQLKAKIEEAQARLIDCQLANGYVGDYDEEHQLGGWDVWGRKYTLLGLLKWHQVSGDKKSLKAARRLLDYTIEQIPAQKSIVKCGYYKGMPPSSILEPVMLMYQITKEERYLEFAKYIVNEMESADGPQLVSKADVPVYKRFPIKNAGQWWSEHNGQKAYEMMSCYIGMLELYRVTGDETLLEAAKRACNHIIDEEINICGSGASSECWYQGKEKQTRVAIHTMETCVTFTWMQFCERLLEFTGDARYADQFERTMYNALMASMKIDGSQIVKYTPLEGYRQEGEHQCGIPINCCNANAPRAFAMIPRMQYCLKDDRIDVNLYIPSTAEMQIGKHQLQIVQATDYPKNGEVAITVNPERDMELAIALRLPRWSSSTTVEINGERVSVENSNGYCLLKRVWKKGDTIKLNIEITAKLKQLNNCQAIERGPVVLARDSRFGDGFVDESCIIPVQDGDVVNLEPVSAPEGMWMAFSLMMNRGAYSDNPSTMEKTYFCDFASAGNTWDRSVRYRVWLPKALNAQVSE